MLVDMHSHYYGGLVEALRDRRARPFVADDAQGRPVLHAMTASTVLAADYTDIAARLAWMDTAGIETQLLTFPGALGVDALPVVEVGPAIADFNDRLAAIQRGSAGRLIGLGGLPLADMARATAEATRLRRELGLAGVILPGNYFLAAAAAERLRPVLAALDREGALVMVHPGLMPGEAPPAPWPDDSVLRASALDLQASLAHMVLTLVNGRLLDDFPGVTFQVVNLGGTIPFVLERIEAVAASREPRITFARERLRRLVYDTASLGPRALELAVEVLGADRIMIGTDHPIFRPDPAREILARARLSAGDADLVARGTARAVLARLA